MLAAEGVCYTAYWFWQGTFVGSFIIIVVAFDRIRDFRYPT
jgi:hypothetical protein